MGYKLKEGIHSQIKVPPGCYIVRAYAHCNNVVTEMAMVQVGCDATVCVSLLPTTVRYCIDRTIIGLKYGTASTTKISEKVPKDKINEAIRVLESVKEYLPKEEVIPEMYKELEEILEKEPEI